LKFKKLLVAGIATSIIAQMSFAHANFYSESGSAVTLTILHNNDGESALLPNQSYTTAQGQLIYGSAAAFSSVMKREVRSAKSAKNAVLSVYAGDSFLASKNLICSDPANNNSAETVYDGVAQSLMPYDVHALGNHEFDYGTGFLKRYIDSFASKSRYPFISGNLDFSANADLSSMINRKQPIVRSTLNGKKLGESYVHRDYATGAVFGIVSAITPTLRTISSPGTTKLTTTDIATTAALINKQVEMLESRGVNKIILVSHLQGVAFDKQLIALLKNVDVAIAGGGDDLLTNPDVAESIQLIPGEGKSVGKYPELVKDANGADVPLITSKGNYNYLGRFDVSFDAKGKMTSYNKTTSYPRRVIPTSSVSKALGVKDSVTPDPQIVSSVEVPLNACLTGFAKPIASSQVVFATDRGSATVLGVRTAETNGGNLIADSFLHAYSTRAAGANLPAVSTANPVVALQNGGGVRQNGGVTLPTAGIVGAINRGNTFDLLPFDNRLVAITNVSAADIKEILERSCSVGTSGGGQFLQVGGLKVTCSRSGTAMVVSNPTGDSYAGSVTTAGTRVKDVTLNDGRSLVKDGVVVAGAPAVTVVTNNFTAEGGDNYPTLAKLVKVGFGVSYEQALYDYLLSFAKNSAGLPEIPATDARYNKSTGEGRFTWLP
jgi:2',3'-cyclic-nucleotide 2'-phosphodiesterase (5'-nucleotidase family)